MQKLALSLILTTGCSVAFQSKPTTTAANDCSASPGTAVVDTIGAVALGVGAGVGIARGGDEGNAIAGVALVVGVLYAASAGNGYRWAEQCRQLERPRVGVAER